ncbi:hypothetical protein SAMN04488515_3601 [Cognatiyoonia koreensis]|uniref:4Fe-4S ferredoxin-type domain-containing protein n=2 Tax=Cognatiyoonia koreensis TaxID=364200 RepID=A0A1I0S005_9RHOB|nr:hypothetical protein SAMN04488515_3601 [Cognatiyoonia koreensis]
MRVTLSALSQALAPHHLIALGHAQHADGTLVLIGPDEPTFWDHFTQSAEYTDGQAHALDRWSTRVLPPIAQDLEGEVYFPFGGPPYHPFQSWALETGRFFTSPIGFLVHETRGLFASFRGAVLLPETVSASPGQNPCSPCAAPCKTACPVGAFADGYNVAACKAHINSPAGRDCITDGCRARRACPVYQGNRPPAQAQFHMEAFR